MGAVIGPGQGAAFIRDIRCLKGFAPLKRRMEKEYYVYASVVSSHFEWAARRAPTPKTQETAALWRK
jgi:hypothetical protein